MRTRDLGSAAVILGLVTSLLIATPSTASESDAPLPPDVETWFEETAPTFARDVLVDATGVDAPSTGGAYTVGEPLPLYDWAESFEERGTGALVETSGEWVAPLYLNGGVVGTIAAARTDGHIEFSYLDDDAAAGRALLAVPEGRLVQDPQLGGLLAVESDGDATGLSRVAESTLANVGSTRELSAALDEAHARSARSDLDGSAGAGSADVTSAASTATPDAGQMWRILLGAALAAAGVVVLVAVRRSDASSH